MGGGVGKSIYAPIRIATEGTVFAMPETKIGFFPDVGSSYFLPRVNNNNIKLGLFLGIMGYKLKAYDLVKYGLATHFVPQKNLEGLYKDII